MSRLLCSALLLLGLACGPLLVRAADVEAGEGEEAPVIAGLLEAGLRAERLGAHHAAETRFCAAARLGSSWRPLLRSTGPERAPEQAGSRWRTL